MRRVREYRYIVREMMQADLERHDGIDELAFFALVLWLQQRQSADDLLAYLDEGPWDGTVRTYLKGIFPATAPSSSRRQKRFVKMMWPIF